MSYYEIIRTLLTAGCASFPFSDQRRVIINSVLNWCVFKQDQVIAISNKFKLIFTLASPLFESLFPNQMETFVIKSKPIGRRLREFVLLVYSSFKMIYKNGCNMTTWSQSIARPEKSYCPVVIFALSKQMLSGFDLAVDR